MFTDKGSVTLTYIIIVSANNSPDRVQGVINGIVNICDVGCMYSVRDTATEHNLLSACLGIIQQTKAQYTVHTVTLYHKCTSICWEIVEISILLPHRLMMVCTCACICTCTSIINVHVHVCYMDECTHYDGGGGVSSDLMKAVPCYPFPCAIPLPYLNHAYVQTFSLQIITIVCNSKLFNVCIMGHFVYRHALVDLNSSATHMHTLPRRSYF